MSLFKNSYELLKEASSTQDCESLDTDVFDVEAEIEDVFGDLDEVEDTILFYNEEMVHVIEQKTSETSSRYLIEMDNIAKYMMSSSIRDVSEAISNIANHNNIDKDSIYIVIESQDNILRSLEESKNLKRSLSKSRGEAFKTTLGIIKMMKTKGINVLKKVSKKKKK